MAATHSGALAEALAFYDTLQDELAEANAIIAALKTKLEFAQGSGEPLDASEVAALKAADAILAPATSEPSEPDRAALNAYLDKAGYRRSGDLVYLTPAYPSLTIEVREPERAVVANIFTETIETLAFCPSGYALHRFRKNPLVLYNHDYDGLPVARSLWERARLSPCGPKFVAKPQFDMDTALSREVWQLVVDGKLSAWELGVIPEAWEKRGDGYYVTKWDVLEYSVVPRAEDMAHLREERRRHHISSPALVKSIMEDKEVDIGA